MFQYLADALRLLRHKRGLKQYQVATNAKVTHSMLSAYERCHQKASFVTLERILRAVDATVLDLALTIEALEARHPESTLAPLTSPPQPACTCCPRDTGFAPSQ